MSMVGHPMLERLQGIRPMPPTKEDRRRAEAEARAAAEAAAPAAAQGGKPGARTAARRKAAAAAASGDPGSEDGVAAVTGKRGARKRKSTAA